MALEDEAAKDSQRSHDLAYAAGRRDADVDGHLRAHENRLNAINGSIDRMNKLAEAMSDKVDGIIATLATNAALEAQRTKQLKDANEKQISNRTFWLGVIAIIAALLAAVIANHHGGVFG